jgi:hypothetical protein
VRSITQRRAACTVAKRSSVLASGSMDPELLRRVTDTYTWWPHGESGRDADLLMEFPRFRGHLDPTLN